MKLLLILAMLCATPVWSNQDPNWYVKHCMETSNWNGSYAKLSACTSKYINEKEKARVNEIRAFLKANPRYMYPGQSLNRCFGENLPSPIESVNTTVTPYSFTIDLRYKTNIVNCYQSKSWDNRDVGK